jgi:hypothetical protein
MVEAKKELENEKKVAGKDYVTLTKKEVIDLLQQLEGMRRKLRTKLQVIV